MARQELSLRSPFVDREALRTFSPPLLLKRSSSNGSSNSFLSDASSSVCSSSAPPSSVYLSEDWSLTGGKSTDGIPNVRFLKPRQNSFSSLTKSTKDNNKSTDATSTGGGIPMVARRGEVPELSLDLDLVIGLSTQRDIDIPRASKRRRVCSTFKPIE